METIMKYLLQNPYGFFLLKKYQFSHWFFKWNQDEEGDIVFSVMNIVHFIKYKEHTNVLWGRKNYSCAPKYVGKIE